MESRGWVLFDLIAPHHDDANMLDHFDLLFVPQDSPVLNASA